MWNKDIFTAPRRLEIDLRNFWKSHLCDLQFNVVTDFFQQEFESAKSNAIAV